MTGAPATATCEGIPRTYSIVCRANHSGWRKATIPKETNIQTQSKPISPPCPNAEIQPESKVQLWDQENWPGPIDTIPYSWPAKENNIYRCWKESLYPPWRSLASVAMPWGKGILHRTSHECRLGLDQWIRIGKPSIASLPPGHWSQSVPVGRSFCFSQHSWNIRMASIQIDRSPMGSNSNPMVLVPRSRLQLLWGISDSRAKRVSKRFKTSAARQNRWTKALRSKAAAWLSQFLVQAALNDLFF